MVADNQICPTVKEPGKSTPLKDTQKMEKFPTSPNLFLPLSRSRKRLAYLLIIFLQLPTTTICSGSGHIRGIKKNSYQIFDTISFISSNPKFSNHNYNGVIRGVECLKEQVNYYIHFMINEEACSEMVAEESVTKRIARSKLFIDLTTSYLSCAHQRDIDRLIISENQDGVGLINLTAICHCLKKEVAYRRSYQGKDQQQREKELLKSVTPSAKRIKPTGGTATNYNLFEQVAILPIKNQPMIKGKICLGRYLNFQQRGYYVEVSNQTFQHHSDLLAQFERIDCSPWKISSTCFLIPEQLLAKIEGARLEGEEIRAIDQTVFLPTLQSIGRIKALFGLYKPDRSYLIQLPLPIGDLHGSFNRLQLYPEKLPDRFVLVKENCLFNSPVSGFKTGQTYLHQPIDLSFSSHNGTQILTGCRLEILDKGEEQPITLEIKNKSDKPLTLSFSPKYLEALTSVDSTDLGKPSHQVVLISQQQGKFTFSFLKALHARNHFFCQLAYRLAPYCFFLTNKETQERIVVPLMSIDREHNLNEILAQIKSAILSQSNAFLIRDKSFNPYFFRSLSLYETNYRHPFINLTPNKLYQKEAKEERKKSFPTPSYTKKKEQPERGIYKFYVSWKVGIKRTCKDQVKEDSPPNQKLKLPENMNHLTHYATRRDYMELIDKRIIQAVTHPYYHKFYGHLFLFLEEIIGSGFQQDLSFSKKRSYKLNPEELQLKHIDQLCQQFEVLELALNLFNQMGATPYGLLNVGELLALILLLLPRKDKSYSQIAQKYMKESRAEDFEDCSIFHALLTSGLSKLGRLQEIETPIFYLANNNFDKKNSLFNTNLSTVYFKNFFIATPHLRSIDSNDSNFILKCDQKRQRKNYDVIWLGFLQQFLKKHHPIPFTYVVLFRKNYTQHNSTQPCSLQKETTSDWKNSFLIC